MHRLLFCLSLLTLPACAIAFQAGTKAAPIPEKFQGNEATPHEEEEREEEVATVTTPTFGMSLVVGGNKMDAGPLPKPPIPVVLLP